MEDIIENVPIDPLAPEVSLEEDPLTLGSKSLEEDPLTLGSKLSEGI